MCERYYACNEDYKVAYLGKGDAWDYQHSIERRKTSILAQKMIHDNSLIISREIFPVLKHFFLRMIGLDDCRNKGFCVKTR